MTVTRLSIVLGLGAALLWAPGARAVEPDAPDALISRPDAIAITIQDKLAARSKELRLDRLEQIALTAFYGGRGRRFLWVEEDGLTPRVEKLRKVLARADDWGLSAADYATARAEEFKRHSGYPADWLAEAELRTSLVAILYARNAQTGRLDPTAIDPEFLDKKPARPDPLAVMKGLADAGDRLDGFLEGFHPPHEQFRLLKQKLAELRSRGAAPQPVTIPEGPSLSPGASHPQVAVLRQRLAVPSANGVISDGPPEEYYDDSLAQAVREFQKQAGLPSKGVVNAATRAALNKAGRSADASEILANMERWRWEPRELGSRYIYVNVPEFMFRIIDGGRIVHEERVVTGTPKNKTPIFNDEMEYVVFNPYWNVPESILMNELLPQARRNPEMIYRNRLEVVWQGRRTVDPYMVDWYNVDPQKISLRQVPGPSNALGVVKFLFPNRHAVYMHDTPTKKLFNERVRAFSHGCVRVRNPVRFAEILLAEQGWSPARVRQAIESGADDYQVTLERKVPVHIMYFTAWVDRDGRMQQFDDIYGHDERVKVALKLTPAPKPKRPATQSFDSGENGMGN